MDIKFVRYAEEKMAVGRADLAGKLARMAKRLNPERSSDIDKYSKVCDIHEAAGREDLYAVLGVKCTADIDTIKKKYTSVYGFLLKLSIDPGREKQSVGVKMAFKLSRQALDILTDPERRRAYDQSRAPPPPPRPRPRRPFFLAPPPPLVCVER